MTQKASEPYHEEDWASQGECDAEKNCPWTCTIQAGSIFQCCGERLYVLANHKDAESPHEPWQDQRPVSVNPPYSDHHAVKGKHQNMEGDKEHC